MSVILHETPSFTQSVSIYRVNEDGWQTFNKPDKIVLINKIYYE